MISADAINLDPVVAEVRHCFEAYERALMANDTATLAGFFWVDPRVLRYGPAETLVGPEALAAYRSGRDVSDLARRLVDTRITAFGPDLAIANTEYVRLKSGRRGRQTQLWVRLAEGWRVTSAHVSLLD